MNTNTKTSGLTVRDAMTESPYALSVRSDLAQLYDLMETKNIRHVPITDDDERLVGLVTHRDLLRGTLSGAEGLPLSMQREVLMRYKVRDIMISNPETTDPDTDLKTAGSIIYENKFGCLPVLEGERLVGILTEADFVRLVVDRADSL